MASSVIGRLSAILELNSSNFSKGIDRAQKRLGRFRRRMNRVGKEFAKDAARIGGIAAVGATGLAIKQFADFEEQLIAVGKVTDMEGKRLDKFGKKVMDLGQTVPVANKELLAIAESAGRLGVEGEEALLAFTETVGKLGTATDLAGEEAATTLARLLNVTGEAAESVGTLGSVLVRLGNNVAATESEIAQMATRIAQSTQRFGTSSAEAAAFGAVLAEMGFKAELAGTAMGRTFEAINKAVSSGGEALRTLEKVMGQTGAEIERAFREDAVQSVRDFAQAIGDLPASEQVKALEDLGLSGQRVIQIITTLGSQTEAVNKVFRLANEELSNTQALNLEAAKAAESFKSQMRFLGNALNEVGVAVGRALAPKIVELGNKFRNFIEEAEKTGQLKQIVRDIATAFNGVVTVIQGAVQFAVTMADRLRVIRESVADLLGTVNQSQIRKVKKELKELVGQQQILEGQLRRLTRGDAVDKFFQGMFRSEKEVRQELEKVNEKIREKIRRVSELARETDKAGVQIGDLGLKTKTLGDNSAIAAEKLNDMGDGAGNAGDGLGDMNKELGQSVALYKALNKEVEAGTGKVMDVGKAQQEAIRAAREAALAAKDGLEKTGLRIKDFAEAAKENISGGISSGFANAFRDEFIEEQKAKDRAKQLLDERLRDLNESLNDGNISQSEALDKRRELYDDYRKDIEKIDKSIGERMKEVLVDSFASAIQEMMQMWIKSGIMGLLSGKGFKGFSIGGLGKLVSGGGEAASAAAGAGKLAGISGGLKTLGAKLGLGSIEAGTGKFAFSGLGGLQTAGAAAAFLSTPWILDSIFNKPGPGAIARRNFAQGRGTPGPAGMMLTRAQGEVFAGGPFAGAAGEFARGQGLQAGRGGGGIASLGKDLEQARRLLMDFEKELEGFKKTASSVFQSSGKSAAEMGQIIKDGVVSRVELANLGLQDFGSKVEMGRDGMMRLGAVSSESFRQIVNAVHDGEIRLEALRGEIRLNEQEMRLLENAGLSVSQSLGEVGRIGAESLRELQGAASDAAGAFRDAAGAVGGGSSTGIEREMRRENRRKTFGAKLGEGK